MRSVDPRDIRMAPVEFSLTRLGGGITQNGVSFPGGLDLSTPSLTLQPGACRDMLNFECAQSGGYERTGGYERFDGKAKPSSAVYTLIQVSAFTNIPSTGQALSQASSGATGTIVAVVTSPTPYMAITQLSGTFDGSGALTVGATAIGTQVATTVSVTSKQDAMYTAESADVYRALIGAVPGSGPIRGVIAATFSNIDYVYAFRDNVGATSCDLYKASSSGWVKIDYLYTVSYTGGGTATPVAGDTLTQGGVTATIKQVMNQTGAWGSSSAAGAMVVAAPSGGSFASGAATAGSANLTLSGAEAQIVMLPGGKFQFTRFNFAGGSTTTRVYGCDGVNKAFEFDGATLAPITTASSPDTPSYICAHKEFLTLAFGSSLVYSAAGLPFLYDGSLGAGEIAVGYTITGMMTLPGSQTSPTLAVFCLQNVGFLYGASASTFSFTMFNTGLGALPFSPQSLSDSFFFDTLGIVNLKTTLNWGNFLPSTLTKNIQPFIVQERQKLVTTAINRTKSQYRAFFSDGYAIYLTMINQQYLGVGIILFPNPVSAITADVDSTNNEVTYFGSSDGDGYVYQLDVGTSFDGANITAYITPAWDAIKSPRIKKRFRMASIEIQGSGYAEVQFGYTLDYNSADTQQPTSSVTYPSQFAGVPYWDAFTWDEFYWDGQTLAPTNVRMNGSASNVQVILTCSANYMPSFTLNSVIYHYSKRRVDRRLSAPV